jgi:hypothetical protein
MGALLSGPHNSPLTCGTRIENTAIKSELMESSAVWVSNNGFCSGALGGADGQNPAEHGTGGTPLIGEEHLSCSQTSENLEGLTEKVGTLGLQLGRIAVVPRESRRGRPSLRRLPLGPLMVVNLSPPQVINHRTCRSLAHLGLIIEWDLS